VKILPVLTRASFHPRDPDLFTEILYGNPWNPGPDGNEDGCVCVSQLDIWLEFNFNILDNSGVLFEEYGRVPVSQFPW
jgi:hypothetical protein